MRFLCDNNIGSILARALQAAGHDVERAVHAVPGADDRTIMAYAARQDCVLVTCDRDFGELVFKHRQPPPAAIIYIRFEPQNVEEIVPRLMAVLDLDRLRDHMTVIGGDGDRRTTFPVKRANDA